MADNIVLNLGSGGDTVRAVDNAGVKTPAVAIGSGSGTGLASADASNGLDVDVTRMTPDGSNTMPSLDTAARSGYMRITDGTLTGGVVDETGSGAVDAQAMGGGTPHDAVDSGNPLKVGNKAIAHGTNPSAVAAGDRTDAYANRAGIPFVIGGHPNVITYGMSVTTVISNTVIGPTVNTGSKFVVTGLTVTADDANTVFPSIVIGFGTANTPAFATTPGTAKIIGGHPGVPAGGGFSRGDGSGIIGVGADDEELRVTTVGNVTGLYIVVTGYTIES